MAALLFPLLQRREEMGFLRMAAAKSPLAPLYERGECGITALFERC
jgi:hypothetical protein